MLHVIFIIISVLAPMNEQNSKLTADKLMTVAEYAQSKGVSVTSVYNWIEKNMHDIKTTKIGKITFIITN